MKRHFIKSEQIKQYLLGTLDPESSELLEERLLKDENLLEEVSAAENDMVHEYLTGALSEQDKERFVSHFLSTPERQRKLKFFSTLQKTLKRLPAEPDDALPRSWKRFLPAFLRDDSLWPKLSLAAVTVLLFFVASWLAARSWRERAGNPTLASVTYRLSPSGMRETGELTKVALPAGARAAELLLPLAQDEYTAYRATLVADGNVERFAREDLQATTTTDNKRVVRFLVPAEVLTRGEYRVKLSGLGTDRSWEGVETYPFRVVQK